MKPTVHSLFKNTLRTFASAPVHFFTLQFLEGLSSVVAKLLEGKFETQPLVGVLIFFPIFCIASTFSNAMTFLSVKNGGKLKFNEILEILSPFTFRLVVASLATGLVFVLGFAALILPAFYFMSIYVFVPQMILSDEKASLSIALFRSTKLAKKSLLLCLITVVSGLGIGIATFLISESFGKWAGGIVEESFLRQTISLTLDAFLSMLTGAMIDIWVSHLYMGMSENE